MIATWSEKSEVKYYIMIFFFNPLAAKGEKTWLKCDYVTWAEGLHLFNANFSDDTYEPMSWFLSQRYQVLRYFV